MNLKEKKIEEAVNRGVENVYPSKEALKKLLRTRKIRVYQGFDPSMPNLHLGNLVGILKLKQFQELGHRVIFLIGDFTGMIGDPTDKLSVRKKLTRKEVLRNTKNWAGQVKKILNFSGRNPAKMMFNSRWLDRLCFRDLIEIASNFTVQRILERDFFQERIKKQEPIFLHEFLYPVAQAIDCVEMDVDMEIGGSDQTFNMLVGRDLMKITRRKEKFVLTTKLLVDKEGRKIGKTTGDAIFLNTPYDQMFGAIMAFPDGIIIPAMELLTRIPLSLIKRYEKTLKEERTNPRDLKKILAFEIVKLNYGEGRAREAEKEFEQIFKKRELPKRISKAKISDKEISVLNLLLETKLVSSKSEAKRLVSQKAVKINGSVQQDWRQKIKIRKGMVIQVGRRRFREIK